MNNLLQNYARQSYKLKELIVILNRDSLKISEYRAAASSLENVRIYSLPERVSLGYCLNYGVSRSQYGLIAKFDDDDYYAPGYLAESWRTMKKTRADIVGKRAHYMYLRRSKQLLLRYPSQANRYVPLVQGATLLLKREVLSRVPFPDQSRGECVKLCADSLVKGYKIYSGSPYNFLAYRSSHPRDHTWAISDKQLLSRNAKVLKVKNARKYVTR